MNRLNMDFSEKVVIDSNLSDWQELESGSKVVPLEFDELPGGRKSFVVQLKKGQSLDEIALNATKEVFIVSGVLTHGKSIYPAGSYLRLPSNVNLSAADDAVVFVKANSGVVTGSEVIHINTKQEEWQQGHGNLQVMPLHNLGTDSAALVLWPAGERFTPHRHWGGEEIFVLSGEFIDEHGRYPAGTWIRSPHMSAHFPYVEKETIILVKVGHLA